MYVWYKRNLYYTMTNIDSGFSAPPTHHPSRYQESKKRATPCRGTIATTSALARANVRSRSNLRHLANTISYLQPRAQSGRCAGGLMSYRSVLPQRHSRRCPFLGSFYSHPKWLVLVWRTCVALMLSPQDSNVNTCTYVYTHVYIHIQTKIYI